MKKRRWKSYEMQQKNSGDRVPGRGGSFARPPEARARRRNPVPVPRLKRRGPRRRKEPRARKPAPGGQETGRRTRDRAVLRHGVPGQRRRQMARSRRLRAVAGGFPRARKGRRCGRRCFAPRPARRRVLKLLLYGQGARPRVDESAGIARALLRRPSDGGRRRAVRIEGPRRPFENHGEKRRLHLRPLLPGKSPRLPGAPGGGTGASALVPRHGERKI